MLKKLWIKGFRNIVELTLSLESGHNFFLCGSNNQGKTNFLESLFFLGNGHSPLDSNLGHLVHFEESEAFLGIDFLKEDVANRLYFKLTKDGKRFGFFNGKQLKSYTFLRRQLTVDFISADIIRIFQDQPDQRRVILDRFCSSYYPEYLLCLRRYEKIVKQKNMLLKQSPDKTQIQFWNDQLVELAGQLVSFRVMALEQMTQRLKGLVRDIFPEFENQVEICYQFKGFPDLNIGLDSYGRVLNEKLGLSLEKEIHVGYCLYGPHRDDYLIKVQDRSLFTFFSRGINRSFAVLFKLSELILLDEKYGNFPILLLDDTFAEIDIHLKQKLVELLENKTRFFYSSTIKEDTKLFKNVMNYHVENGMISYVSD